MTDVLESAKKVAQAGAKLAQKAMSDKPPKPVELGGAVEKQPAPGAVICPAPLGAPQTAPLPGGAPDSESKAK